MTTNKTKNDIVSDEFDTQILELLVEGKRDAEIAETIALNPSAVKRRILTMRRKLGAGNRVGLAMWWMEQTGREPAGISLDGISKREREVVMHVVQGMSNRAIAEKLGMQESTVRVHMRRIFNKLKVTNRTELATAVAA